MRILVLNFEYPPLGGGASPVCHEINKRYVLAGHLVTVITMHFKGLSSRENIDGVEVFRIKCIRRHKHLCHPHEQLTYLLSAWSFLKVHLKTNRFDICHAHFLLPTGLLCYKLKKKFGIPYVITAHGSDIPHFNPDRFKFLHLWTPPLIRRISKHASYLTSPSKYLGGLMTKAIKTGLDEIKIIPNGIDTSRFSAGRKENYIVSSGRLLPRKGFKDLLMAVHNMTTLSNVHLLGEGPMRPVLEKLAATSHTPVTLHGWMDNRSEAYKNLLESAAIYCLVSSRENASVSILEAMASGCAIITSDDSGCPELVADAGLKVPFGNPEEIKQAITTLQNNQELRSSLSQKALARVHLHYDWNIIVPKYLQLLHNASSKRHK